MSRKYTKVEHLATEIQRLREDGKTYREIGEQYGLSKKQVKELMKRLKSLGMDPAIRGERLSAAQFAALSDLL